MPSHATFSGKRPIPRIGPTTKTLFAARFIRAEDAKTVETCATSPGITVAAIEDDERMRQALVFQVATAGIEVDSYASAKEFLEAANANDLDCIVVDVNLPKMNGLQLQEEPAASPSRLFALRPAEHSRPRRRASFFRPPACCNGGWASEVPPMPINPSADHRLPEVVVVELGSGFTRN